MPIRYSRELASLPSLCEKRGGEIGEKVGRVGGNVGRVGRKLGRVGRKVGRVGRKVGRKRGEKVGKKEGILDACELPNNFFKAVFKLIFMI